MWGGLLRDVKIGVLRVFGKNVLEAFEKVIKAINEKKGNTNKKT